MVLYDDPVLNEQQGYTNTEAVRRLPFPDNLAAAVILAAIADLKSGNRKRRHDAQVALESGGLQWWVQHMSIGAPAMRRISALLDELGR